jgi:hypothetical protein
VSFFALTLILFSVPLLFLTLLSLFDECSNLDHFLEADVNQNHAEILLFAYNPKQFSLSPSAAASPAVLTPTLFQELFTGHSPSSLPQSSLSSSTLPTSASFDTIVPSLYFPSTQVATLQSVLLSLLRVSKRHINFHDDSQIANLSSSFLSPQSSSSSSSSSTSFSSPLEALDFKSFRTKYFILKLRYKYHNTQVCMMIKDLVSDRKRE